MEHTFKPWQPVIVRDGDTGIWAADFFSHYRTGNDFCFVCTGKAGYRYCLPAEGNEYLVGTTDSQTPSEPEFKQGDMVEIKIPVGASYKVWVIGEYFGQTVDGHYVKVDSIVHHVDSSGIRRPPEPEFKFGDKVEVRNDGIEWRPAIFLGIGGGHDFCFVAVRKGMFDSERFKCCRHADW